MADSEPIRKYQPIRRVSIAPATSVAPEAPVMVAPGAPSIESPVSQASREREVRVRRQFEDIEARYRRALSRFPSIKKWVQVPSVTPCSVLDTNAP